MNNWWIATLNVMGLLNREQAAHLSDEIKSRIHKESFNDTISEVVEILEEKKLNYQSVLTNMQDEINELKAELEETKALINTKLARKKKA
jgi:translation initiation factor 2 gamma subunit (eIF-2gamma)